MSALLRTALMAAILAVMMVFSQIARAEYYLEYPEPVITQFIEYTSPHYHHLKAKKHHTSHQTSKRRSNYSISVIYYLPVCPGCTCAATGYGCYPNDEQLNTSAVTGGHVAFSYDKKNFGVSKHRSYEAEPTFDQRTEDDDVMYNPNMNNQYNMY